MRPKSLFRVLLLCIVLASLSTKIFQNVYAPTFPEPLARDLGGSVDRDFGGSVARDVGQPLSRNLGGSLLDLEHDSGLLEHNIPLSDLSKPIDAAAVNSEKLNKLFQKLTRLPKICHLGMIFGVVHMILVTQVSNPF